MSEDPTKELFSRIENDKKAVVLNEIEVPKGYYGMTFDRLKQLITLVDGKPRGELYLESGTLAKGSETDLVDAYVVEEGRENSGEGYSLMYSVLDPTFNTYTLAKRTNLGRMTDADKLFFKERVIEVDEFSEAIQGASVTIHEKGNLPNNFAVDDDDNVWKAEFIAVRKNGQWRRYREEVRESLIDDGSEKAIENSDPIDFE